MIVCDASALAAALLDSGDDGTWAREALRGDDLAAPMLTRFECANVIRRHELAGLVASEVAAQAHADLIDLPIDEWPYESVAARAWALRENLTAHDASYVALAELLAAPLVTLDRRITASGVATCVIRTPAG